MIPPCLVCCSLMTARIALAARSERWGPSRPLLPIVPNARRRTDGLTATHRRPVAVRWGAGPIARKVPSTQPLGMPHIIRAVSEVDARARREEHAGVNRLYEAAAELVGAARALRETAGRRDAWPAHPSMLGCVETVLCELRRSTAAIADASRDPVASDRSSMRASREQVMCRGLDNLEIALVDAEVAASAARALCARALGDRARD
jgi:hypothetical protein